MCLTLLAGFVRCLIVSTVMLFSCKAFALYNDCTAPLPAFVNIPTVSIPSNLPIGQTIPGSIASFTIAAVCSYKFAGTDEWLMVVSGSPVFTLVPGFTDVYTVTGMGAGIGFRMRGASGAGMQATLRSGSLNTFDMGPAKNGSNLFQGSFELVRTAAVVSPGTFNFPMYFTVTSVEFGNGGTEAKSVIKFGYTLNPVMVAACTVQGADIAVILPSVPVSALSTPGATAGGSLFEQVLNCENGAKPQISLTDAANPSNQSTELSLAPGSTAGGVAIQILANWSLVRYGPAQYTYTGTGTATSNAISMGVVSGSAHIPFNARYVRTTDPIKSGSVRGAATFTLNYQ